MGESHDHWAGDPGDLNKVVEPEVTRGCDLPGLEQEPHIQVCSILILDLDTIEHSYIICIFFFLFETTLWIYFFPSSRVVKVECLVKVEEC